MSFQLKKFQQSFLLSILPATTTSFPTLAKFQMRVHQSAHQNKNLFRGPTRVFLLWEKKFRSQINLVLKYYLTRRHQVFIIFMTGFHPCLLINTHSLSTHDLKSLSMSFKHKLMTGQDTEIWSLSNSGLSAQWSSSLLRNLPISENQITIILTSLLSRG